MRLSVLLTPLALIPSLSALPLVHPPLDECKGLTCGHASSPAAPLPETIVNPHPRLHKRGRGKAHGGGHRKQKESVLGIDNSRNDRRETRLSRLVDGAVNLFSDEKVQEGIKHAFQQGNKNANANWEKYHKAAQRNPRLRALGA